jgi:DNA-binding protein HU-beta
MKLKYQDNHIWRIIKMKKTELIAAVAEQSGLTKKDAEKAVNAVIDTIINAVAADDKIQITGFGTFEQRTRNARTGCDPRTGNKIEIPASKVPAFKAGKSFKEIVNK